MKALLALAVLAPTWAQQPPPIGRMIAIEGGRRLHVSCSGKGSPAVVLLNGVPRYSIDFALLQPQIAKFARVCVYDRAGDAWSDAAPGPPSIKRTVGDLDKLLNKLRLGSRVILVGHSAGGLLARAYQLHYPKRVRGMVLVDSTPEDWSSLKVKDETIPMYKLTDRQIAEFVADIKLKPRPQQAEPSITAPFDKLPPDLQEAHLWATRGFQDAQQGQDLSSILKYQRNLSTALYQASRKPYSLGNLPLAIVSRGTSANDKSTWVEAQRHLAKLSHRSKFYIAVSGHDIELEKPEVIVAAVRALGK